MAIAMGTIAMGNSHGDRYLSHGSRQTQAPVPVTTLHNYGSGALCLFSYDDGVFIAVHIELEPFVAAAVRDFRDG